MATMHGVMHGAMTTTHAIHRPTAGNTRANDIDNPTTTTTLTTIYRRPTSGAKYFMMDPADNDNDDEDAKELANLREEKDNLKETAKSLKSLPNTHTRKQKLTDVSETMRTIGKAKTRTKPAEEQLAAFETLYGTANRAYTHMTNRLANSKQKLDADRAYLQHICQEHDDVVADFNEIALEIKKI
jgi:hypothetical protein